MDTYKTNFQQPARAVSTLSDNTAFEGMPTEAELGGTGRLVAQVYTANQALPIQGAVVTIMTANNEILSVQTTNISGKTPGIELSAPLARYSQAPGGIKPYSTYNLRVESPGYYSRELLNVAVFDSIESVQPVALEPLLENANENDLLS